MKSDIQQIKVLLVQ